MKTWWLLSYSGNDKATTLGDESPRRAVANGVPTGVAG